MLDILTSNKLYKKSKWNKDIIMHHLLFFCISLIFINNYNSLLIASNSNTAQLHRMQNVTKNMGFILSQKNYENEAISKEIASCDMNPEELDTQRLIQSRNKKILNTMRNNWLIMYTSCNKLESIILDNSNFDLDQEYQLFSNEHQLTQLAKDAADRAMLDEIEKRSYEPTPTRSSSPIVLSQTNSKISSSQATPSLQQGRYIGKRSFAEMNTPKYREETAPHSYSLRYKTARKSTGDDET